MRFIPHPAVDSMPVSFWRWAKWHVGEWFESKGRRWQREAMDICDGCGRPKHGWDHSRCDDLPF